MSANRRARARRSGLTLALLTALHCSWWPLAALAADGERGLLDRFTTPFLDPLFATPPNLLEAKPLPGDNVAANCPDVSVLAQRTQGTVLSLDEAITLSLCFEPQVHSALAAAQEKAANVGSARAAYFPSVNAAIGRTESQTHYPGSDFQESTLVDGEQQNVGLTWRLWDFGTRRANLRSAQATLQGVLATRDYIIQRKLAAVIKAYFDMQTTIAAYRARQETEALNQRILETAKRRLPHGMSAYSDVLLGQASVARAHLETQRALADMEKAGAVLNSAIGGSLRVAPLLPDDAPINIQEVQNELGEWLAVAEREHPALLSARLQWESARQQVVVAQSDGLPTVDLGFNYYRNGRPNTGLSPTLTEETVLAVTLNIPLFDGFSRTYKVRAAQAQMQQKEAELDDTRNQVLLEVAKSFVDVRSALGQVSTATDFRESAKGAAESIQRKYEKGAAEINELLNAQASLSDAELERIRAIALLRSAKLSLFANAGKMGHHVVQSNPR